MKITAYNQHDVGSSHEPWSCSSHTNLLATGPTSLCNQAKSALRKAKCRRSRRTPIPALQRCYRGPSTLPEFRFAKLWLRSDVMKARKSVPPRVEYVLEAQALKEARDDPRWRRSSPEILLHDGVGSKRQDS